MRFHCIYWPAILHSAGLPPPSDIVVHGFLTVNGRKIGKALGSRLPNPYRHRAVGTWSELGVGGRVRRGEVLFPKLTSTEGECPSPRRRESA